MSSKSKILNSKLQAPNKSQLSNFNNLNIGILRLFGNWCLRFGILQACIYYLLFALCYSADISAPKMQIIDTPQGRTTVFPQGITITDKDMTITGKNAVFYEAENRAIITDSILITNPQFTITADTGYYYFSDKKSNLKGNVVLESDTLRITTPNLTFEQSRNIVKAHNGILIREKIRQITIFGETGEYNFKDATGLIDSSPIVHIERKDITIIKSARMLLKNNEARFWAIDSVSAKTGNTILKCDTLLFFIQEDSGIAIGNPQVIDSKNRITGNTIRFYFGEEDSIDTADDQTVLKMAKITQSASAYYVTDDGGIVEVSGNLFTINYLNGDIENIIIIGEGQNKVSGKYFPKEEL